MYIYCKVYSYNKGFYLEFLVYQRTEQTEYTAIIFIDFKALKKRYKHLGPWLERPLVKNLSKIENFNNSDDSGAYSKQCGTVKCNKHFREIEKKYVSAFILLGIQDFPVDVFSQEQRQYGAVLLHIFMVKNKYFLFVVFKKKKKL